jgi:hypothetical protein
MQNIVRISQSITQEYTSRGKYDLTWYPFITAYHVVVMRLAYFTYALAADQV